MQALQRTNIFCRGILVVLILWTAAFAHDAFAQTKTENVILVTFDGLRREEVFTGADERLISRESGVREVDQVRGQFWRDDPAARRQTLLPFFWETIAKEGQVFGDPAAGSEARVTNGRNFSYPGYNEILCGFGDEKINSNDKRYNDNTTVLEWLHNKPAFNRRVAAFCSWDVFPFIINDRRSGIPVNAGWMELAHAADEQKLAALNELARQLPHYWSNVRYDALTAQGAIEYLRHKQPRVLYVSLGETDDWAHEGRYDLYLGAALRDDGHVRDLWEAAQALPQYRGRTSLVLTTDHGRGDGRDGWKSHGASLPGSEFIWIAVLGPDTPALGVRENTSVTQSQIAATTAALLGEDFTRHDERIAKPLPAVVRHRQAPAR